MESAWLQAVKRIHAIAETGIAFNHNNYEYERYHDIIEQCQLMMSMLTDSSISKIENLLSVSVEPGKGDYVTPKIDVRGAVFQDGKILLVKEKVDGLWSMPGGYADVGLSAAENTEKEVFEEAGIQVKAIKLYAVRHKAKNPYKPDIRDFYKFYFLCEALPEQTIKTGMETDDVGFFTLDNLPQLSSGRVIEMDILQAWEFVCDHSKHTIFD